MIPGLGLIVISKVKGNPSQPSDNGWTEYVSVKGSAVVFVSVKAGKKSPVPVTSASYPVIPAGTKVGFNRSY